jgi:hypothetical protein
MNKLPLEIILYIGDILAEYGYIRTYITIQNILNIKINNTKLKYYLSNCIFLSRKYLLYNTFNNNTIYTYNINQINLFKYAGIDDGIHKSDLLKINTDTYPILHKTLFSMK